MTVYHIAGLGVLSVLMVILGLRGLQCKGDHDTRAARRTDGDGGHVVRTTRAGAVTRAD